MVLFDTKNRFIELDFYTFEYYSRVNSLTVVFPCFSWFLLSDESPSYSLDNQISKNQFQELKSCLFGFHHGQITEENHVLFLSTKTATEASYVETPSQFDTRLSRLSDELRRLKVHSMSFLRDKRLYDKKGSNQWNNYETNDVESEGIFTDKPR